MKIKRETYHAILINAIVAALLWERREDIHALADRICQSRQRRAWRRGAMRKIK